MDFDETYEKLQKKKELDEIEEEVLISFSSSARSVAGLSWEIHREISRMRKLNDILRL